MDKFSPGKVRRDKAMEAWAEDARHSHLKPMTPGKLEVQTDSKPLHVGYLRHVH